MIIWEQPCKIVLLNMEKLWEKTLEKTSSNKTPALTKSMNMDIWVVGTSNQKNKVVTGSVFVIGPFCTYHSIYLNITFRVLYVNSAFSILLLSTKKRYPSFLKRFSFSRKSISKFEY